MQTMLCDGVIYLRSLEEEDLDKTHEWFNTSDLFLTMGVMAPFSKSVQKNWYHDLSKRKDKFVFAVCLLSNKQHIGNVSLDLVDFLNRNARFSIFLAEEDVRGKGYGTRATNILLEYAFNYLNLNKIYAKMDAKRKDVQRYYEKIGFVPEGIMRRHEFRNGEYIDKMIMAIFRETWHRKGSSLTTSGK